MSSPVCADMGKSILGCAPPVIRTDSASDYTRAKLASVASHMNHNQWFSVIQMELNCGYVAGGFPLALIRKREDWGDIDMFFKSWGDLKSTYEKLTSDSGVLSGYKCVTPCTPATKVPVFTMEAPGLPTLQLIQLYWAANCEDILDTFDLSVSKFALDLYSAEFVFKTDAILHVISGVAEIDNPVYPADVALRMAKYVSKGFKFNKQNVIDAYEEMGSASPASVSTRIHNAY